MTMRHALRLGVQGAHRRPHDEIGLARGEELMDVDLQAAGAQRDVEPVLLEMPAALAW